MKTDKTVQEQEIIIGRKSRGMAMKMSAQWVQS